ncbi:MAG TPA: RNA methyltransferase, partial [Polyangiaceae bacterium LLY-WYZ-14_1]|nr:RNA methyltransferase [Polyangiaceae bacterium LLY-WYZ-14_1]
MRDSAFDDGTPEDRSSDRDDTDDGDGGRVRPAVHVALVHHPVLDRQGAIITTAVTNLDIHDIARSARSYGFACYWVVTPIEAQRTLVGRVLEHWRTGAGARRI